MPKTVLIKDIVEALATQFDEISSFLDLETGKVESMSHDELRAAEEQEEDDDLSDLHDWEKEQRELARRIVFLDRFVKLPTKFEVHEWEIMRDFAESVKHKDTQDELLDAIHGAGAFRTFKNTIRRRGIDKTWHAFRTSALKEIAIDWCKQHNIPWS